MHARPYIFYLQDSASGSCYYVDSSGNIQSQSIMAAGTVQDVSLQHAPDGWMEATLGYSRNTKYYGFNRSYSDPLKLVKDAAYIARTKFYTQTGVETKLSLLILKYNSQPAAGEPTYKLYHKAPIDFPQKNDKVAESFTCNLLEGGILQMLKTYENTVFSIPCDGSIPENIKVNMDGMYFQDTFNYQIANVEVPDGSTYTLPTSFLSNDGDNIGIIHNNPTLDNASTLGLSSYVQKSANYMFSSVRPISVRIKGSIAVQNMKSAINMGIFYATSLSTNIVPVGHTHAGTLLQGYAGTTPNDFANIVVSSPQTVYFDTTVSLAANENLFLFISAGDITNHLKIVGGNFTLQFNSIAADTAPWCVTAYDLLKLLVKNINQTASTSFQSFNFGMDSTLLQSKLNLVCTSGDAIRASGDPNYQKFYNAIQANPNFPNVNNTYSFGPVIKTSLSEFFQSFNAILNASLGNQTLTGKGETVFFENKGYVFNSTADTFDLGEVSDFEVSVDVEKLFTILKIGYEEQNYDQKSGKYEWNTTLQMVSPINSVASKTMEILSKYRADAYGIERLRANIDKTSSTKNSSDNSVFVINTDQSSYIYDYFEMLFASSLTDPTNSLNTNLKLIANNLNQGLSLAVTRSGYFSVNNDPSILVLSEHSLSSSKTLAINITGSLNGSPANLLTGAPADFVTINVFVNGAIVKTYTVTATSPSTAIAVTDSLTRTWHLNDNIYVQANTSATGIAQLDSIDLNMASGYFDASGANITVDGGSANRMIALPTITAPLISSLPVLSYGFQYLQFNAALANKNFTTDFKFSGVVNGSATPGIEVDLYVNGIQNNSFTQNGTGTWIPFSGEFTFTRDWTLGDIMFTLASTYSTLTTEFQNVDMKVTSTQIKAYALKRVQYDYISGIPALCGYVTTPIVIHPPLLPPITVNIPTAIPITTGPGAPYNIEDLTPKQMLMNWGNYLRSILWDQPAGQLQFSTLSKNQYLVTTKNGVTLVQNANVPVGSLDQPLFSLNKATFRTRVPMNFDQIMRASVNAFLSWTYNGQYYYGFAEDMKQKSTLNEMQQWEALIA